METPHTREVPERELITKTQAARILGVSLETVSRYSRATDARPALLTRYRNPITRVVRYERAEVEKLRAKRQAEK